MSTLLFRYWTFNMSFVQQMSTLLFRYSAANVNFASSILDIQYEFVQQMSTLLFRYWTFNMSLYSKCQLCYFDIGHSIWISAANVNFAISLLDIQCDFLQQMSNLLFRYWTFNMSLYSKWQLCYFVIGHSIWVWQQMATLLCRHWTSNMSLYSAFNTIQPHLLITTLIIT